MGKNKNVPKLRFPEFEGEWERKLLEEVVELFSGGTPRTDNELYWNGKISWFTPSEIKTKYVRESKRKITELGLKNSSAQILPSGTILLTTRATIGECAIALNECTTNQGFQSLVIRNKNSNEFIYYWTTLQKESLLKLSNGSTFPEISKNTLSHIYLEIPSIQEQTKIASFLTAVDENLQLLKKKKELLEKYKKGVMQKLFSQELRFKDDDGKKFPDWEEKKLGDIAKFSKGKGISKADIHADGATECIRYGELYTTYKEIINEVTSRTSASKKNLVLSEANDVIIPSSGETKVDIATASCVLRSGIALGGDLSIIKTKNNGVFLSYYLKNKKKIEIASLAQGNSVVHLYSSQLSNLNVDMPSINEQNKIANVFSNLDVKLNSIQLKIEKTEAWKKGLLQKMFV